jgi:hypothetical protein
MDPLIWGPHLWFTMHTLSFNYPKEPTQKDKKDYFTFYDNLTNVIPCKICKEHYTDFFNKNSIIDALDSRDKLIVWVMEAHNNVNKITGKPTWTKEKVFSHYQSIYERKYDFLKIAKFILVLFILLYFYNKCKK